MEVVHCCSFEGKYCKNIQKKFEFNKMSEVLTDGHLVILNKETIQCSF